MAVDTWKYVKGKPIDSEIEKLQESLGVLLPKEFLSVAIENNGGRPSPCIFDFPGRDGAVFESLLRLERENDYGILKTLERISDRLPSGCVPFASDPFGNYLCFQYPSSGMIPIVFWNHEKKMDSSLSPVCDDFEALLEKLYEPKA